MHKSSIDNTFIKSVTVNTDTCTSTYTKHTYTQKGDVRLFTAFKGQMV